MGLHRRKQSDPLEASMMSLDIRQQLESPDLRPQAESSPGREKHLKQHHEVYSAPLLDKSKRMVLMVAMIFSLICFTVFYMAQLPGPKNIQKQLTKLSQVGGTPLTMPRRPIKADSGTQTPIANPPLQYATMTERRLMEEQLKKEEEEILQRLEQKRRAEEEEKFRYEADLMKKELEELRQLENALQEKEEELRRKDEEIKRKATEKKRKEQEVRKVSEEIARSRAEIKKKQEFLERWEYDQERIEILLEARSDHNLISADFLFGQALNDQDETQNELEQELERLLNRQREIDEEMADITRSAGDQEEQPCSSAESDECQKSQKSQDAEEPLRPMTDMQIPSEMMAGGLTGSMALNQEMLFTTTQEKEDSMRNLNKLRLRRQVENMRSAVAQAEKMLAGKGRSTPMTNPKKRMNPKMKSMIRR